MDATQDYLFTLWYVIPAFILTIIEVVGIIFKYILIRGRNSKHYFGGIFGSIIFILLMTGFVYGCVNVDYTISCTNNITESCVETNSNNFVYFRIIFWIFMIFQCVASGLFYFTVYRSLSTWFYTINFFIIYCLLYFIIYYNLISAWCCIWYVLWISICVLVLWIRSEDSIEKFKKFSKSLAKFKNKNVLEKISKKEVENKKLAEEINKVAIILEENLSGKGDNSSLFSTNTINTVNDEIQKEREMIDDVKEMIEEKKEELNEQIEILNNERSKLESEKIMIKNEKQIIDLQKKLIEERLDQEAVPCGNEELEVTIKKSLRDVLQNFFDNSESDDRAILNKDPIHHSPKLRRSDRTSPTIVRTSPYK